MISDLVASVCWDCQQTTHSNRQVGDKEAKKNEKKKRSNGLIATTSSTPPDTVCQASPFPLVADLPLLTYVPRAISLDQAQSIKEQGTRLLPAWPYHLHGSDDDNFVFCPAQFDL